MFGFPRGRARRKKEQGVGGSVRFFLIFKTTGEETSGKTLREQKKAAVRCVWSDGWDNNTTTTTTLLIRSCTVDEERMIWRNVYEDP